MPSKLGFVARLAVWPFPPGEGAPRDETMHSRLNLIKVITKLLLLLTRSLNYQFIISDFQLSSWLRHPTSLTLSPQATQSLSTLFCISIDLILLNTSNSNKLSACRWFRVHALTLLHNRVQSPNTLPRVVIQYNSSSLHFFLITVSCLILVAF